MDSCRNYVAISVVKIKDELFTSYDFTDPQIQIIMKMRDLRFSRVARKRKDHNPKYLNNQIVKFIQFVMKLNINYPAHTYIDIPQQKHRVDITIFHFEFFCFKKLNTQKIKETIGEKVSYLNRGDDGGRRTSDGKEYKHRQNKKKRGEIFYEVIEE